MNYKKPKQQCIICDIDGTISEKTDRGIYDYSRVNEDREIEPVMTLLRTIQSMIRIVFVTGREDVCREETIKWIDDHGVHFFDLHMRKHGDNRRDEEVKQEILNEKVKTKYEVLLAIEDRKRVKYMWTQNNIFVLDVNQSDTDY